MKHSNLLVAIVAALSLTLPQVAKAKDLYQLCSQFDSQLKEAVGDSTDPEINFTVAQRLLALESPLESRLRTSLAQAWRGIRDQTGCSAETNALVSRLHECRPLEYQRLQVTLGADITKYVARCGAAGNKVFDHALESSVAKDISRSNLDMVNDFISEEFIEQYRRDHPEEKRNGLETFVSFSCCLPEKAGSPAYKSLLAIYGGKYNDCARDFFQKSPQKIESYVAKWLIKPCIKYVKALEPAMQLANDAADFFPGGDRLFIASRSKPFQDTLFRYKLCSRLAFDEGKRDLIEAIKSAQATYKASPVDN